LVPSHVLGTLLARALFADTGYLAIHVELKNGSMALMEQCDHFARLCVERREQRRGAIESS
jgi:hypothetical protein